MSFSNITINNYFTIKNCHKTYLPVNIIKNTKNFVKNFVKGPPSTDWLFDLLFLLWKFALLIVAI